MDDAVADDNISILKQLAPEWTNDEIHLLVKKYDHDLDKAANALLSDENIKDTLHLIPATQVVIPSHREVIDLTTDDTEEMTRALQMSMEANNVQTTRAVTFGPSNRPPDADWAMTLSSSVSRLRHSGYSYHLIYRTTPQPRTLRTSRWRRRSSSAWRHSTRHPTTTAST